MAFVYQWNPLELQGPSFLVLYISLLAVACLLTYFLRKWAAASEPQQRSALRYDRKQDHPSGGIRFDAYEAAYLSGGSKLAIETAIATLLRSKALHLSFVDNTISAVAGSPRGFHPFEQAVYRVVESGEANTIKSIRSKAAAAAEQLGARLKALGLIISEELRVTSHLVPLILMAMVLLFGVMKVFVGLSRNRPVGFLFVLCVVTALIAYFLFKSRPLRTNAGDASLDLLKRENAALEATAKSKPEGLATGDVALAMALFGMTALAFTDQSWSMLKKQIFPPSSGSSGGSSCSSSSCSSSSSCGSSGCSGGCGGGGCGGCGS